MKKIMNLIIDHGPCDWEIIQHTDGYADIPISGFYNPQEEYKDVATVYLRIVDESTEDVIIGWQESVISEKGKWEIVFKKVPVGGLYRIESCVWNDKRTWIEIASKGQNIHHIGVGDVFIIAGQSNAAGTGRGSFTDSPEIGVHVLRNCEKWDLATNPFHDTRSWHSPFLAFAKKLKKTLHYPIGLIPCAYGGSNLNSWLSNRNGEHYRYMINVMKKFKIKAKAVLWYQGCSDAYETHAYDYFERFTQFVETIRKDLNNQNLPILTYQLNRLTDELDDPNKGEYYGIIRECQRQAEKKLTNVYVVPTVDAKMSDGIHNSASANVMLGERLAKKALNVVYHKRPPYNAPDLNKAEIVTLNVINLVFDNIESEIMCFHVSARNLPIKVEDENGIVNIKSYCINRNILRLKLERSLVGKVYVSGQYGTNPNGLIQDMGSQLPMLCFNRVKVLGEK